MYRYFSSRFQTLECFQNSCSAFLVPMIFLLCYWILFHGKSLDNENKHMRFVLYFNLLMCTNLKIFMDPRYCKRIDLGSKRSPTPPKKQCEDYGTGQFLELSGALLLREIPHCTAGWQSAVETQ